MISKKNRILKPSKIRVGITIGDPSGIGPVILLKALPVLKDAADFVVIGDGFPLEKAAGACARARAELEFIKNNCMLVGLDNVGRRNFSFGRVRAEYGRAAIAYLDAAVDMLMRRDIDCLVTCPISKEALAIAGIRHTGHTEYLARRTNAAECVMMLTNRALKISLVTRHLPLARVPHALNSKIIFTTMAVTEREALRLFGMRAPRMAVCGVNPHASDNGRIGDEEKKIIIPALRAARRKGIRCDGPLPADAAMLKASRGEYDLVTAMYHDQALIALKMSGSERGVNLTLGLPFVRTSPLHGTAFDIAGDYEKCDPSSLIEAICVALSCASRLKRD